MVFLFCKIVFGELGKKNYIHKLDRYIWVQFWIDVGPSFKTTKCEQKTVEKWNLTQICKIKS